MIITNKLGLPKPLVDMAQSDYKLKPNEYRVTSLFSIGTEEDVERIKNELQLE